MNCGAPPPRTRDGLVSKKPDAMAKVLEKATPLAQPLAPKNEAELSKLRQRMAVAGFHGESAGTIFFARRFFACSAASRWWVASS